MSDARGRPGLVAGVDGGNSKTDLILADTEGELLAWLRGVGTHPQADTMPVTAKQLGDLLRRALDAAGRAAEVPIDVGAFFIANVDVPEAERAAVLELSRLGLTARTVVHNDTFAVLHAGAPEGWGVAVVCGAGINATGVHPDGRSARYLSLGDISGDWGGGQAVGTAGLGAAVRAGDGRGPATRLREILPVHFGLGSVEDVALAVNAGELRRGDLLQLSPLVFAAAAQGDEVAAEILIRLGDEIVTMVTALLLRLDLTGTPTPVILGGGTLQHGQGVLLDRIRERLADTAPHAQPHVLDVAPVAGAVIEALAVAGAPLAVRHRIRAAVVATNGPTA